MGRSAYLWGTRKNEYCELGRTAGLEDMLRRLGAVNPALALEETRNMLSGCTLPKEGTQSGSEQALTIRYSPVHLYKKQEILKNMAGFSAFCVNGPEEGEGRERYYSHLTLMDREDLAGTKERTQTWLDRIFGTLLMTPAAEKKIREGAKGVELAPAPSAVDPEIGEAEKELAALIVTALYHDAGSRIVICMPEDKQAPEDALRLLAKVYSLLPEKMAVETGFSIGEQPSQIAAQTEKSNIRIFFPAKGSVLDPERDLPEKSSLLDLSAENGLPENYDTEMAEAVRRWEDLSWDRRRTAMKVYLADEGEYFRREYYLEGSKKFFDNAFWDWLHREDLRFDPGEESGYEAQYKAVKELYKAYAQFDICRKVPWVREEFIKHIPEFLMEGDTLESLRQAVVRKATEAGDQNPNTVENCHGYRKWLTELLGDEAAGDDAFECALLVAEDAKKRMTAAQNEALEEQLREKDALIQNREEELRSRDLVLEQKEQEYRALQAEIADKEAQWGAFVDSLEQQMGSGTVVQAETDAARKINPMAARQVDGLQLELAENRELLEETNEELRRAKEQLEHEKRGSGRYRAQTEEVIKKLKLAMIGVLIVGILIGAIIGLLIP